MNHPEVALVENNHLIKRRNVADGKMLSRLKYYGWVDGASGKVEALSNIYPDATMALPVAFGLVDPQSALAHNTMEEMNLLWNRRWSTGGYDRYNTTSQGDQPGPWTFATMFIIREAHEAGMYDISRRGLEWMYNTEGGDSGAWHEEIPLIRPSMNTAGLKARIRYRDSFISYSVEGTGKPVSAIVNDKKYKIGQNGKITLGDDFNGGEIVIRLK